MLRSKITITIIALLMAIAVGLLPGAIGHADRPSAQDDEKTLDIERYPGEPLELVDLRIGAPSVRDRIAPKTRRNKEGLDSVKFKEKAGWYKRVTARLRNVSDQPVTGLRAFLYFQPPGERRLFSLPLARSNKEVRRGVLPPGAEMELTVSEEAWALTAGMMQQEGTDAEQATVTLSVESVMFGDDSQWHRGRMLRRSSDDPTVWTPVGAEAAVKVGRSVRPAQVGKLDKSESLAHLKTVGFKLSAASPQGGAFCKEIGGYQAFSCTMSGCYRFEDLPSSGGTKSQVPVSGVCLELNPMIDDPNINCTQQTTHTRLQEDSSCPPCPDNDHDGLTTCAGDCNDNNSSLTTCCPTQSQLNWCAGHYGWWDYGDCKCEDWVSPIVIDTLGDGFELTDAGGGVLFDINGDGAAEKLSWTSTGSDDAWLALDRNGNGAVDDGRELFGNFTPQDTPPLGVERNGFLALAVFDRPEKGGNGDGVVDRADAIYSSLRLWRDANHNGVSETGELEPLPSLGVESISLDYREARKKDRHGNEFRFRTKINGRGSSLAGKWAYDVLLLAAR